uniref:Uncharacterized protein n=1 Tax=Anguilla anguilla TaxID=7936 RepID=A0A0E9XVG8_ANGAN
MVLILFLRSTFEDLGEDVFGHFFPILDCPLPLCDAICPCLSE